MRDYGHHSSLNKSFLNLKIIKITNNWWPHVFPCKSCSPLLESLTSLQLRGKLPSAPAPRLPCLSSLAVPSTQVDSQSWRWCWARKEAERGQKESWADESTRGLECRKKTEVCSSPLVPRKPQMAICEGVSRWGSLSVTEMLSQDWRKMKTSIYTGTTQESTMK